MGWVLFFDGECAFCAASVRRTARLDRHQRVKFAPLQGKFAAQMKLTDHAQLRGGTMVLLRESDGKMFTRSDALLELARALGGWWRGLCLLKWVPRWLRDGIYQWIADHRRRFLKRGDFCEIPDPAVQRRLLD